MYDQTMFINATEDMKYRSPGSYSWNIQPTMRMWLEENCIGRYLIIRSETEFEGVLFTDLGDATTFKMEFL